MLTIGTGVRRVNFISPKKKHTQNYEPNAFENVGTNNNNDDGKITVQSIECIRLRFV